MTTYKAKQIISKMLKYYTPVNDFVEGESKRYAIGINRGIDNALYAFINEFNGRKREKLEAYAKSIIQSKAGRTE